MEGKTRKRSLARYEVQALETDQRVFYGQRKWRSDLGDKSIHPGCYGERRWHIEKMTGAFQEAL